MKEKTGKKRYPTYSCNPSIIELREDGVSHAVKNKLGRPIDLVSTDGEAFTAFKHDFSANFQVVDAKPFMKVYDDLKFGSLSKPSLMMLDYIQTKLKPHKDTVVLDVKECMEYCSWEATSRANFYKGVDGLLSNEIIFNKTGSGSEYYINVRMLFNGDRRRIYQDIFLGNDASKRDEAFKANMSYKVSKDK